MRIIKLQAPRISAHHIKQHITCIRPKRVGGPNVSLEQRDNKIIANNYGHGGFGWTFLPGSVRYSIEQLSIHLTTHHLIEKRVTVIGAGCYGLLSAIWLHEQGFQVRIVAEETEQLASHKAAGSASVIAIKASKAQQPLMDQLEVASHCFYHQAVTRRHDLFADVKQLPVYMLHEGNPHYFYPMVDAGVMPEPETVMINFGATSYQAKRFETFFIETINTMNRFMQQIEQYRIPIERRKITDLNTLSDPIIFNCSGLGARTWDQTQIVPVQGHLVMLQDQPLDELQYILYAHIKINGKLREVSWTPKNGGMLGGSALNFQDKLDTNQEQAGLIIERALHFFGITNSDSSHILMQ